MSEVVLSTTLKRPPAKLLARFHVDDIGEDTVESFLTKGYSLAICCRKCPRLEEWTPPILKARYGDRLGIRIADLASRLRCKGDGGCGSQDVAVFPHLFDHPWTWSPPQP